MLTPDERDQFGSIPLAELGQIYLDAMAEKRRIKTALKSALKREDDLNVIFRTRLHAEMPGVAIPVGDSVIRAHNNGRSLEIIPIAFPTSPAGSEA
jgi:hypothetical protein